MTIPLEPGDVVVSASPTRDRVIIITQRGRIYVLAYNIYDELEVHSL